MATSIIPRKWTCIGCGYHQNGTMSYYKWNKMWNANHLAHHNAVVHFGPHCYHCGEPVTLRGVNAHPCFINNGKVSA